MAGKRSGEPAAERACGPRDKEFNGARFKALLRDPAAAAKGLETFVSVAKTLPSPQVYDVVEGYVKISVELTEILKLLDGERKAESEGRTDVRVACIQLALSFLIAGDNAVLALVLE